MKKNRSSHEKTRQIVAQTWNVVGIMRLTSRYVQHHAECPCVELLDQRCECGLLELLCSLDYPGARMPEIGRRKHCRT